ncbi:MAG: MltA domain-containing protein [Alphaproteobacteria bacterium]|nr:MltA domain-containing protein [Alphaproteobacteria bacterium]
MTSLPSSILQATSFHQVEAWQTDDLSSALETFKRSYNEIKSGAHGFKRSAQFGGHKQDWLAIPLRDFTALSPRRFFERHFVPVIVNDPIRPEGLFTGYYEPQAEGSLTPSPQYPVAIYRRPPELVGFDAETQKTSGLAYGQIKDGQPHAFATRQQIEQGALAGRGLELVWLKNWVDAFFIHIQGSGRITLNTGGTIRLAYAAKNGQPYTSIGGELLKRNVATPETMSMQVLRRWMDDNPSQARELMWCNSSFIFFRDIEVPGGDLGALGAQQVNLTPLRSLAVDRSIWMYGTPLWLNTMTPLETWGGPRPFQRLMIAQDTGTAIRGYVRGDVYWGWGEEAAHLAGHMKSQGRMTALLPQAVARRLQLSS